MERALLGEVQHALRHRQGERRQLGQLRDELVHGGVELGGGHHPRDEPERERLLRADAAAAHDRVLRPREADQPDEALRPAAARDHPELHLGEGELDVVGRDAEVAGERELEADAEGVALQLRDHRLRAALRRGDVPVQARELLRARLEEAGDVAAGGERPAGAGDDDEAHGLVGAELAEHLVELGARAERHAVELAGDVERDRRHAALGLDAEALVLGHVVTLSSRRSRRSSLPDGLLGRSSTKRYSRGRLNRASVSEARQCASSSSAVSAPSATT